RASSRPLHRHAPTMRSPVQPEPIMRPINSSHTRDSRPQRHATGPSGRARGIAVGQGCLLLAIGLSLAACNPQKADNDTVVDDTAAQNAAQTVRPGGAPVDEVRS